MNCPTRVDPEALENGWNQNPNRFASETNSDNNGVANRRIRVDHKLRMMDSSLKERTAFASSVSTGVEEEGVRDKKGELAVTRSLSAEGDHGSDGGGSGGSGAGGEKGEKKKRRQEDDDGSSARGIRRIWTVLMKFARFVGPGFMVAVAYIDPGNYATDVAAGASYQFRLLCMVLISNIIAIFLQTLCIKLGSVTGMNLAQNIKAHCPPWLNYVLWFLAEAAIISTDIAEVIGTAIALNVLIHVPLVAGCAISIVDVLVILLFYDPKGSMRGLRMLEIFVVALVLGVVICFCIELSLITIPDVGELFRGFLPSSTLVQGSGLYQACGILGATVMPHSLYLGSGIVQPRLLEFDRANGLAPLEAEQSTDTTTETYKPSVRAIRSCLSYSVAELIITLLVFALFINSAILIVAGASLHTLPGASDATLFQIHDLLSSTISPAAGVLFGLALLLSGTSAGIICTIAGQMVAEGQIKWTVKPWVRRLMTRSFSITPSIIIAGAVGKQGLSTALEASQVVLSVILPFVSAPLIYFTCRAKFMTVTDQSGSAAAEDRAQQPTEPSPDETERATKKKEEEERETVVIKMKNHWITTAFAVLMWLMIVVMNVAALVFLGLGKG